VIHPLGRQELADRALSEPHTQRLDRTRADFELICDRHDQAMAQGARGYLDPKTGLFVMTAKYLADRGFCCSSGCRHCPYVSD